MRLIAEFSIKGAPELPNDSMYKHWNVRRKNAFKWKRLVQIECMLSRINGLELDSAVLTYTRHSSRECDFDNLVASFKACQDGIVAAQVIVDDKPTVIGRPTYKWVYRPRKQGLMITVKIETKDVSSAV